MERGMTADQVLAALWRRKFLVGGIALAVFLVGAAMVMTLPSMYHSTSVVHVEQQHPAAELVQRTVSENMEQRLLSARQELMGRPVLERVIKELNLYPALVAKKGMDAAVEAMRLDMDVKLAGESAFELTYQSTNPQLAAKVANRIPQIYGEQMAAERQQQAARATAVFGDEINALKSSVTEWETKIAQFKVDHIGELPEQMEVNMRGLERTVTAMNTKSEELRVAEAHRSDLAMNHYAQDSEAGRLKAAEDGLTQQLVSAKSTWTEDHPEVQRLNADLRAMKQKRQGAEQGMGAQHAERARSEQWVKQIQADIVNLQKDAQAFQKRLESTPKWAQELGVLERDYEITKTKYQSVVSRKVEAEIAEDLEAKNAKTMFDIVSPAGVPQAPFKPDRLSGLLIAFLVGLGLGTLTGVVLEMRDDSIRDIQEIKGYLPLPVLAVIPQLQGKSERRILLPANGRNLATSNAPSSFN